MSVARAALPVARPRVAPRRGARAARAVAPRADAEPHPGSPTSRRAALGTCVAAALAAAVPLLAAGAAGGLVLPGLGVVPDKEAEYLRTPLGVVYEQINDGVGEPAKPGDVAVFHWILRRANGTSSTARSDAGSGAGTATPTSSCSAPKAH